MRGFLNIITWISFILTAITASFAGWLIFTIKTAEQSTQNEGLTFLFVSMWLGLFGLASLVLGVIGFIVARKDKVKTPLIVKLCLAVVAIVLAIGLVIGVS